MPSSADGSVRVSGERLRSRLARRRWRLAATVVGVVTLLAAGTAAGLWVYAAHRLDDTLVAASAASATEETGTILVVGVAPAAGRPSGARRVDTVLLLQPSAGRGQAAAVTFPPDLAITAPPRGRLAVADTYAVGGRALLRGALEDYTGVRIDHVVEIDVEGLAALADAVGGVAWCPPGSRGGGSCEVLDAPRMRALVTAPAGRAGDSPDGGTGVDLAVRHELLRQTVAEATSPSTLLNPFRVKQVVDVVAEHTVTDVDLGPSSLLRLAGAVEATEPEDLDLRIVPGSWHPVADGGGVYPEQAEALFQALRSSAPLPDVGRPAQAERTAADEIDVLVLNGIGKGSVASKVAAHLGERGLTVVAAEDAETYDPAMGKTMVAHGPGAAAAARAVARFLPGSEVVATDGPVDRADVVVTVANDWLER